MKMKVGALLAAALVAAPLATAGAQGMPGFYIGGEGGLNKLFNTSAPGKEKLGFAAGGFIGYDFVGPRVEIEGVHRSNKVGGNSIGQTAVMANVLYDFFPTSTFTPMLGVGAGVSFIEGGNTEFAYQVIAGMGINLSDNFRINIGPRYHGTTDPTVGGIKRNNNNLTGMIQVALKFGAPAAPPPPPVTPPTVKKYVVFFDFDRSNITPTAANTIKQAATDAKAGKSTKVDVTGHADRSGSDQYNMALSLRRANAVKDQLVREGIPANQIVVVGRGETQPLVNTADGVREPQNRRVEIVLE